MILFLEKNAKEERGKLLNRKRRGWIHLINFFRTLILNPYCLINLITSIVLDIFKGESRFMIGCKMSDLKSKKEAYKPSLLKVCLYDYIHRERVNS